MNPTDNQWTIVRGRIDSLIGALPSLRHNAAPLFFGDNSAKWKQWIRDGCLSSGELCAAQFVLHVWNPLENRKEKDLYRFDLSRAMNVWDDQHLAVFASWARNPWYA